MALVLVQQRLVAPASAQRVRCSDFEAQAAAQEAYRAVPLRYLELDRDRDGIVCESLPCPCDGVRVTHSDAAPSAQTSPVPVTRQPTPLGIIRLTPTPTPTPTSGTTPLPSAPAPEPVAPVEPAPPPAGLTLAQIAAAEAAETGGVAADPAHCTGALEDRDPVTVCLNFVAERNGLIAYLVYLGPLPRTWLVLAPEGDGWRVVIRLPFAEAGDPEAPPFPGE